MASDPHQEWAEQLQWAAHDDERSQLEARIAETVATTLSGVLAQLKLYLELSDIGSMPRSLPRSLLVNMRRAMEALAAAEASRAGDGTTHA